MDFQVWFNQIPSLSKFYLSTIFITSAAVSFEMIRYSSLSLDIDSIIMKWQVSQKKKSKKRK